MKKNKKFIKHIFAAVLIFAVTNSIKPMEFGLKNVRVYPQFEAITYSESLFDTYPMANLVGISSSIQLLTNLDFALSASFQAFHDSYIIIDWKAFSAGFEYQLFGENIKEFHFYPRFGFHTDFYVMKGMDANISPSLQVSSSTVSSLGFSVNAGIDLYFPRDIFLLPEFSLGYILKMPEYAAGANSGGLVYKYKLSLGYRIPFSFSKQTDAVNDEEVSSEDETNSEE
ncbi:MAG: hypothetical protein OEZ22_03035 [Spirochaetia bacterium]|nr:hypothetical protein [Spirochaetia bacterium]